MLEFKVKWLGWLQSVTFKVNCVNYVYSLVL